MDRVTLIGFTTFVAPEDMEWDADARDADAIAEFAGRACYESWRRLNPATATNAGYLENVKSHGHMSVLEHASATFYLRGVSRSFTHELVRHRHLSFSQRSQRYVDEAEAEMILPDVVTRNSMIYGDVLWAIGKCRQVYKTTVSRLEAIGLTRKEARQAARCVMPNATETRIVVTGNMRAWRHFIRLRASLAADVEIRDVALDILRSLQAIAPNIFADFEIVMKDGVEIAVGKFSEYD